jgi:hypothetical protein
MKLNRCNDRVLSRTREELEADNLFLTRDFIEEIVSEGQFKFASDIISKGEYENINIAYLGKIRARTHLLKFRDDRYKEDTTKQDEQGTTSSGSESTSSI